MEQVIHIAFKKGRYEYDTLCGKSGLMSEDRNNCTCLKCIHIARIKNIKALKAAAKRVGILLEAKRGRKRKNDSASAVG